MFTFAKTTQTKTVAVAGALVLTVALTYPAQGATAPADSSASGAIQATHDAPTLPGLRTRVVMANLDIPWDVAVLPSGSWLVTERDRLRILIRHPDGSRRVLADHPPGFWAAGETGLMSILADPNVAGNGRFYTCNGFKAAGPPQIRVNAWKLNKTRTRAKLLGPLLKGIDINSGRHGGCRLRFDPDGLMYVGTGDAAVGTNPQDLHSLNGKLLRLNRFSGKPSPKNPWPNAKNTNKRYIYNYGHRNVQGLAWRPGDRMWSVEHGPDRNDEVNRAIAAGNYGWNPVPGYNESVPMTDFSLPGRQIGAKWRSGNPTIATSGATWVKGKQWGRYRGTLAVCALIGERMVFMKFTHDGTLAWTRTPPALRGDFGRLRTVVQDASGALLVTTSNESGTDVIVRVTPR